jgi:hypothetical protein
MAQKLKFFEAEPQGTDKIKVVKMRLVDALGKVMNGGITHDVTSLLILKADTFLKDL